MSLRNRPIESSDMKPGTHVRDCVKTSFVIIISIVARLIHNIRKRPNLTAKESVPDLSRLAQGAASCAIRPARFCVVIRQTLAIFLGIVVRSLKLWIIMDAKHDFTDSFPQNRARHATLKLMRLVLIWCSLA